MKRFSLLILLFSSFSLHAQFSNETMQIGSETRSFRQYLPTGFDAQTEQVPLIIAFHGIGDNMTNFSNVGFHLIADTARFIVLYPQGLPNAFSQNSWNNGTVLLNSPADDLGFVNQLIDSMHVRHNIDLSRVYVCGFSMGGIMSYHTVCALPNRIAALASVSGTMSDADVSSCNPGRSIPIMHLHGTADATVPYDGAALPSLSLVPATISFWQNNNGCTDSTVTSLPDLAPSDSITVDQIEYNNCGAPVELWRENDAIHQWLYTPVNDINTTVEIWLFFRDKSHPGPSQLDIEDNSYAETQVSLLGNNLQITSTKNIERVNIFDIHGRVVRQINTQGKNISENIYGLENSVYIIHVSGNGFDYREKVLHIQ